MPPSLQYANYWKDSQNNILTLGGAVLNNNYSYNTLWKYNPTDNTWTWVSGSNMINQNGAFGTQGVSSVNNFPSSIIVSYMWTDNNGNMWMFGGYGLGETGTNSNWLSTMWKYSQ